MCTNLMVSRLAYTSYLLIYLQTVATSVRQVKPQNVQCQQGWHYALNIALYGRLSQRNSISLFLDLFQTIISNAAIALQNINKAYLNMWKGIRHQSLPQ